jgi:type III secretory pathway component EscR
MSLDSESTLMACSAPEIQVLSVIVENIGLLVKRTISEMTIYGVYFVLSALAMHSLIKRQNKSRQTWILLSAFILTFLLVTAFCAVDLVYLFTALKIPITNSPTETFTSRMTAYYHRSWYRDIVVLLGIIGD